MKGMPNGVTHEKKGNKRPFIDEGLALFTTYCPFPEFLRKVLKIE